MDIDSAIQNAAADRTANSYGVGVLKKAQNEQRLVGELAVRLIDQSGQVAAPQMTKTADGHISVRA